MKEAATDRSEAGSNPQGDCSSEKALLSITKYVTEALKSGAKLSPAQRAEVLEQTILWVHKACNISSLGIKTISEYFAIYFGKDHALIATAYGSGVNERTRVIPLYIPNPARNQLTIRSKPENGLPKRSVEILLFVDDSGGLIVVEAYRKEDGSTIKPAHTISVTRLTNKSLEQLMTKEGSTLLQDALKSLDTLVESAHRKAVTKAAQMSLGMTALHIIGEAVPQERPPEDYEESDPLSGLRSMQLQRNIEKRDSMLQAPPAP